MDRYKFDWDSAKEKTNIQKHGIDFEIAQTVFEDPNVIFKQDRIVEGEERWHALGQTVDQNLIVVSHTVTHENEDGTQLEIRLISARASERWERKEYSSFYSEAG
jgi:uncharacterized DUF497 family protein